MSYSYIIINYKTLSTAILKAAISLYCLLNAQDSDKLSAHWPQIAAVRAQFKCKFSCYFPLKRSPLSVTQSLSKWVGK